jgi:DNA primase
VQSEQNQRLLASVLMQETDELTPELIDSALQALRRRKLERDSRTLSHNIAEAEKKNDSAGLAALLQEKLRIERELRE